jgi:hypothetical protein
MLARPKEFEPAYHGLRHGGLGSSPHLTAASRLFKIVLTQVRGTMVSKVREYVVVKREPLIDKVCPVCGQPFQGLSRQRYYPPSCRHRADYQRHVEQRKASQRQRRKQRREGGE